MTDSVFEIVGDKITYREPKTITNGIVTYKEAVIVIDTSGMYQEFVLQLMRHISDGKIRVEVAND